MIFILLSVGCAKLNEPKIIEKVLQIDHFYDTIGFARDIFLSEQYLYIAEDQGGFTIYDLETDNLVAHYLGDIENARLISAVEERNLLFVYDRYGSPAQIRTYDISDPADPQVSPPIITSTAGIEDMLCWAGAGETVEVAITRNDSQYEFRHGSWDGFYYNPITVYSNFTVTLNGFTLDDENIYLAYEQLGLNIVDYATGNTLCMVDTPGEAIDVKVVDNLVFIADKHAGFAIIDISNLQAPVLLSSIDTSGWAQHLDVNGSLLAVASGGGGIYLYDISDPVDPEFLDRVDDQDIGYTYRVLFKNDFLYAATKHGVYKIEIDL